MAICEKTSKISPQMSIHEISVLLKIRAYCTWYSRICLLMIATVRYDLRIAPHRGYCVCCPLKEMYRKFHVNCTSGNVYNIVMCFLSLYIGNYAKQNCSLYCMRKRAQNVKMCIKLGNFPD